MNYKDFQKHNFIEINHLMNKKHGGLLSLNIMYKTTSIRTKKSTLQNVICDTFVSAESICHVLVRVELPWEKYLVMDQNLFTDHVT